MTFMYDMTCFGLRGFITSSLFLYRCTSCYWIWHYISNNSSGNSNMEHLRMFHFEKTWDNSGFYLIRIWMYPTRLHQSTGQLHFLNSYEVALSIQNILKISHWYNLIKFDFSKISVVTSISAISPTIQFLILILILNSRFYISSFTSCNFPWF